MSELEIKSFDFADLKKGKVIALIGRRYWWLEDQINKCGIRTYWHYGRELGTNEVKEKMLNAKHYKYLVVLRIFDEIFVKSVFMYQYVDYIFYFPCSMTINWDFECLLKCNKEELNFLYMQDAILVSDNEKREKYILRTPENENITL